MAHDLQEAANEAAEDAAAAEQDGGDDGNKWVRRARTVGRLTLQLGKLVRKGWRSVYNTLNQPGTPRLRVAERTCGATGGMTRVAHLCASRARL